MTYVEKYTDKLRKSGLRPTKQRIKICEVLFDAEKTCLLYTSPSPRDLSTSRMPSSA